MTLTLIGGFHSGVRRDSADAIVSAGSSEPEIFPRRELESAATTVRGLEMPRPQNLLPDLAIS